MSRPELKPLRTRAHALKPALSVGESGVTDAFLDELDRMLAAQELVKVRFPNKDRTVRAAERAQLAEGAQASVILSIGKVATYWREGDAVREANQPDEPPTA